VTQTIPIHGQRPAPHAMVKTGRLTPIHRGHPIRCPDTAKPSTTVVTRPLMTFHSQHKPASARQRNPAAAPPQPTVHHRSGPPRNRPPDEIRPHQYIYYFMRALLTIGLRRPVCTVGPGQHIRRRTDARPPVNALRRTLSEWPRRSVRARRPHSRCCVPTHEWRGSAPGCLAPT
jgi:hypothetical protein